MIVLPDVFDPVTHVPGWKTYDAASPPYAPPPIDKAEDIHDQASEVLPPPHETPRCAGEALRYHTAVLRESHAHQKAWHIVHDVIEADVARYFWERSLLPIRCRLLLGLDSEETVLSHLEDLVVGALEEKLMTSYCTSDPAGIAREVWQKLPAIFATHSVVPQRPYLRPQEMAYPHDPGSEDFSSIVDEVRRLDVAGTFASPVLLLPKYAEVVPFPIDLSTIWDRSKARGYATTKELWYDLNLMCTNCRIYNPQDTEWYGHAVEMLGHLDRLLPVYARSVPKSDINSVSPPAATYLLQVRQATRGRFEAVASRVDMPLDMACVEYYVTIGGTEGGCRGLVHELLMATMQGRMLLATHPVFS